MRMHAVRIGIWIEQLLQDCRYALRTLRGNPAFALVVTLTLGIAIGMNTAVFSVFNAVVLRPLAYPHAERLVWLSTIGMESERGIVVGPDFVDWRTQATSFDRMAAYGNADETLVSAQGATRLRAARMTHDFWDIAGARPVAGRLPADGEEDAVLLSQRFAQRWFAGDPAVVGRTVLLDGRQVTIVGVLPEGFRFHLPGSLSGAAGPQEIDVYRPLSVSAERTMQVPLVNVVGRLKAGVTLAAARAEIAAIQARIAEAHPGAVETQRRLRLLPLHDELIGGAGRALLVLVGAVAFVLLIACANAANLLLARASARHREIAVRMSVGASRGRVLRHLLVESLVLAAAGGAAGLLLARAGIAALLRVDPNAIPRLGETTMDGRVLLAVLAASVLTAMLFGLAPALALWRIPPNDALKGGVGTATSGAASARVRRVLVAGEVALALVLLAGAGLMLKSASRMLDYPPGFEPDRVLTARLALSGPGYSEPHRQTAFADALLARLRTDPRVEAATISTHGSMLTAALMLEGEPKPSPEELSRKAPILISQTSAALQQVMGFRMLRGRWLTDAGTEAVINESLARRDFTGRDPVGRRFRLNPDGPLLTIVGVAADVKFSKLDAPAELEVFVPYARTGDGLFELTALVRTAGDPLALAPVLRSAVSDIDRTQVPDQVATLEQALSESIAPRRMNLLLLGTFASAALFLATIGIYGVMAYSVAQRVREIGVRMALGAQRADVVRMVVRQGMRVMLAGIAVGVAGALSLTRLMESLLYEVEPTDPMTFAAVSVGLGLAGFLACCVPAVRAARVDPVVALRSE